LPVAGVVLAEAFQGIDPGQPDGGLVVPELLGGLDVQVGHPALGGVVPIVLGHPLGQEGCHVRGMLLVALAAEGQHQRHRRAHAGPGRQGGLDRPLAGGRLRHAPAGGQQQPRHPTDHSAHQECGRDDPPCRRSGGA
jgi:hypothetical protein